jgi:hypothetical protein
MTAGLPLPLRRDSLIALAVRALRNITPWAALLPRDGDSKELKMKYALILTAFATAFGSAAYAQTTTTTTEYYVVQDTTTKKCTIVDKKPTTTTMVQVGPVAFKSRAEAESGMKTIKVCTTN